MTSRLFLPGIALLLSAGIAEAQATLSAQGLGYPAGGLSTQAAAMGGGIGELDPQSAINPAALAYVRRPVIFLQYAPEFRRVISPDAVDRSTVIRFPMVGLSLPVGLRATASLTATTLADRTWGATVTGTQEFVDQTIEFTDTYIATGATNDVRLAGSYALTPTIAIGVGAHLITGESELRTQRVFEDTTFLGFNQRTVVGYSGAGVSGGVVWRPTAVMQLGLSGRAGGSMRAYMGDSVIARADVPSRFGAGLHYTGIAGTLIATRVSWDGWSALSAISPEQLPARDGWEYGIGVETRGPVFLTGALPLRAGFRRRDLPFVAPVDGDPASGESVSESTLSFGTALSLAADRAIVDLTFLRSSRNGHPTISERGWGINVGLTVRP